MLQALKKNKSKLLNLCIYGQRDEQKCHFTLETYGGYKATNFGTWNALKLKGRGSI